MTSKTCIKLFLMGQTLVSRGLTFHDIKINVIYMSRIVRKPDFCLCENKGEISFAVTAKLINAFVFATRIVPFLYFLNKKKSSFKPASDTEQACLCQTWSENPEDRFSNVAAQLCSRKSMKVAIQDKFDSDNFILVQQSYE